MRDERFDELMADARHTYNRAPDLPPFEEMWEEIDRARHGEVVAAKPRTFWANPWLRTAAVLILGIGLGRISASVGVGPIAQESADSSVAAVNTSSVPSQYDAATDEYLGEAAALLIALPGELSARKVDSGYMSRADELLSQTRLLLDSPAAADPQMRALFEDLELVLVQVVRLQAGDTTKIDLLNQALQDSHVIPRLRDAVVDHIAD